MPVPAGPPQAPPPVAHWLLRHAAFGRLIGRDVQRERLGGNVMEFLQDRRVWIGVAVVVVLVILAYALGWFGGETPAPPPAQ